MTLSITYSIAQAILRDCSLTFGTQAGCGRLALGKCVALDELSEPMSAQERSNFVLCGAIGSNFQDRIDCNLRRSILIFFL